MKMRLRVIERENQTDEDEKPKYSASVVRLSKDSKLTLRDYRHCCAFRLRLQMELYCSNNEMVL
jgi:hypothetical protein